MKPIFKTTRAVVLAVPFALVGGVVAAGGLAEPVVTPAPVAPVAPVYSGADWTGFYAGGQLGYADIDVDAVAAEEFQGATYGVHAGYLYDLGSVVLGAEVDVDGANIEEDVEALGVDVDVDLLSRAKLIAGYDAGAFLPYVTLGAVRADLTVGDDEFDDTGAFAGLGLAYNAGNNWRVAGEVLQHQFEDFGLSEDGSVESDIDATTASLRVSYSF